MEPTLVEFGERYADDSGWERRVLVNRRECKFEIDLFEEHLSGHARDLRWLIKTLQKAEAAAYGHSVTEGE